MRQILALSALAVSLAALPMVASAHETAVASSNTEVTGFVAPPQTDRAAAHWTAERIANAKPMAMPTLSPDRFPAHKP